MKYKTGIELITQERQEQIEKHGRTIELDVELNTDEQLIVAAAGLISTNDDSLCPVGWNEVIWDKMISKPYKERLIIAGALIAAEIDRLDAITFIKWYNSTQPKAMKYKYPESINTPEAKKVYRRLKREINWYRETSDQTYYWYTEERSAHNALKEKLKELAK